MLLKKIGESLIGLKKGRPLGGIGVLFKDRQMNTVVVIRRNGNVESVHHANDFGLLFL